MLRKFLALILLGQAFAGPVISEFMASNDRTLTDEDGDSSDWIEIYNPDAEAVDLGGLFLTDDSVEPNKWQFPPTILEAGDWLVVYASGKDRAVSGKVLHTNFKLDAKGESLALVAADGVTILSDFGMPYREQFEDISYGTGSFGEGYMTFPTPGFENSVGTPAGPNFVRVIESAGKLNPGQSLEVTAEVIEAAEVNLVYRVNFEDEITLPMLLGAANQYSATLPGAASGDLVRWRYTAKAPSGIPSRAPGNRLPNDSPVYFGTVVRDSSIESNAPVLEWFIEPRFYQRLTSFIQPVRGGIYYNDEYYDNVSFTLHGQSTLFFAKKSFNLDFNKGHRFRWKEGEPRVRDIDLLTNWADKSKSRQVLAYELLRDAGVPTHFALSVRVQQNGAFFSVADLIEDADDRYLERAGLNPDGVLYKAYDTLLRTGDIKNDDGMVKKTRKEESNADLHQFIRGINRTGAARWDYIYDHVDLPGTINTLAGLVVIMQTDMFDKNYYLYRDTGGSDEWSILPWDLDLTFGRDFRDQTGGYFDNKLYTTGYTEHKELADSVTLVDYLIDGNVNTRAMFFRRLRTLSDQFLMSEYLDEKLDVQLACLDPSSAKRSDARLDFEKWGSWKSGSPVPVSWSDPDPAVESMAEAVVRFRNEWLPARRTEITNNVPDLPSAQNHPAVMFGMLDDHPVSGNQDEEYIELLNQESAAVDLSGWTIAGGVTFEFPAGTVLPPGGTLYVGKNPKAFRARLVSPTGGEQRFLVGPYSGRLSNDGETIELFDPEGNCVDSKTFSGSSGGFDGNGRRDRDHDGIAALLEYALGTSDRIHNALSAPVGDLFSYTERSTMLDFSLVVETSRDLIAWTRDGVEEVGRTTENPLRDRVTVRLPSGGSALYLRLVVVRSE